MANPIFMCCSCKLIFLNETGYKCHLKSRPSHNQPVVDEIDNIDEHQDDELHGPNQLDPVSWQQRHTNNNNLNDQELPIEHPDFFGGRDDSITYLSKQLDLYKHTFGIPALRANDIEQFVNLCHDKVLSVEELRKLKVLEYGLKYKLSRSAKDDMLKLMKVINPNINLPSAWKTMERKNAVNTSNLKYLEKVIPYPAEWQLELWSYPVPLEELIILVRDPIELISYQLVDPVLQFQWKNHISYNAFVKKNDKNERVISDTMTTTWAHKMESLIRIESPEAIFIPIFLYTDGVSLGHGQNKKCNPVMGNIGNFSDELLRKDFSKFTLGFIPFIDSSSEESIVQHLMVKCGPSRTLAEYSLKIFKLEIDKYFWKEVLTPIEIGFNTKYKLNILGNIVYIT